MRDWKTGARRWAVRLVRPALARCRKRLLVSLDGLAMLRHPVRRRTTDALLIRTDNIGDFVLWLHAAEALSTHFRRQGRRVRLLANQGWSALAEDCGLFDEVVPLDTQRFAREPRYRWRIAGELRAGAPAIAIRVPFTRVLEGNEALLRLSGARQRVGLAGIFEPDATEDERISNGWYTALWPLDGHQGELPEMLANALLVRRLADPGYRSRVADLRQWLPLRLPAVLERPLQRRPYFALFPGATFAGRLWPAERFAALAGRIAAATGWVGVVCGGPGESAQAQRICAGTELLNWTGQTTLPELAAVLAGAQLLVSNESAAVHIAAAAGTPSVCLVGGGHFGRFVPYAPEAPDGRPLPVAAVQKMPCFGCNWRCAFYPPKGSPMPCIEEIGEELAWAAVEQILQARTTEVLPIKEAALLPVEETAWAPG